MKALVVFISLSLFAHEYLIFNDELVLFSLAFLTHVVIIRSFTPMITQLAQDTSSALSDNFSKSLNENELGFNNTYFYALNVIEKVGIILNVIQIATASYISAVFQNEIKAYVPNYNV